MEREARRLAALLGAALIVLACEQSGTPTEPRGAAPPPAPTTATGELWTGSGSDAAITPPAGCFYEMWSWGLSGARSVSLRLVREGTRVTGTYLDDCSFEGTLDNGRLTLSMSGCAPIAAGTLTCDSGDRYTVTRLAMTLEGELDEQRGELRGTHREVWEIADESERLRYESSMRVALTRQ